LISTKEFTEYFLGQIAARKAQPTGDLLCDIANAKIDGEELTDDEQLGMLQQFLVAGNETTTNLISNMIRCLAENPDLQNRLRQQPELIEAFVEEMLRSEAPVGGLFRQAKVDVDIAGTTIPAGDHMWLVFASANRDECKFAAPDSVDPERTNVKDHLAFGNGEHFCPGAGLARAEARIALQLVLEHLDDIKLASDNDFPYGDSFVLRGLTSLKITATPKN
jgi:cytochrome P450